MRPDLGLVRLSTRPARGCQGRPHPDDVVAQARHWAETTNLNNTEIGARLGVTAMTIGRWARSGGWRQMHGRRSSHRAWGTLADAERRLAILEGSATVDLDRLASVFARLMEAGTEHRLNRRGQKGKLLTRTEERALRAAVSDGPQSAASLRRG